MASPTVRSAALSLVAGLAALAARTALAQPANDACANATSIGLGVTPFLTTGATTDGPDPQPECDANFPRFLADVWFRYVPNLSGTLTVSTCNQTTLDTKVAAYTGTCGILTLVGCSEDAPGCNNFTSEFTVQATGGVPLLIRLGSFDGGVGAGTITLSQIETGVCCASDNTCTVGLSGGCNGTAVFYGSTCTPNPCLPLVTPVSQTRTITATANWPVPPACNDSHTASSTDFSPFNAEVDAVCPGRPGTTQATQNSAISSTTISDDVYLSTSFSVFSSASSNCQFVFDLGAPASFSYVGGFSGGTSQVTFTGPGTNLAAPGNAQEGVLQPGRYVFTANVSIGQGDASTGSVQLDLSVPTELYRACCTPVGSCTFGPAAACTGGVVQGPSASCTPNVCPLPSVSCCLPTGQCLFVTAASCTGGVAGSYPSTCTPNTCPQPGACCDPNAACTFVFPDACNGIYEGPQTVCAAQNCAADADYYDFYTALVAREIIRWEYAQNANPRMYAVLMALRRVATINPNAKTAQLNQFATAYDQMLAAAYPNDPKLLFGVNLMTAVRFPASPVTMTGMNLDVGADVLTDLGLDPAGPPFGDRTWQLAWFQAVQDGSLTDSTRLSSSLLSELRGIDAAGGFNPALRAAAIAYVRTQPKAAPPAGCAAPSPCWYIDPAPSAADLHSYYPQVEAALQLLPSTAADYAIEAAAGFPRMNALITSEMQTLHDFNAAKIQEIHDTLHPSTPPAGPVDGSLAGSLAAATTQSLIDQALADRAADLSAVATSRARLGIFIEIVKNMTPPAQQEVIDEKLHLGAAQTSAAQWMSQAKQAIHGLFTIAGSAASIYESKGLSAPSEIGNIQSGLNETLGAFGLDADIPLLGDITSLFSSPQPPPDNTVRDGIYQLSGQMESMRSELDARFNKVDQSLSNIYSTMLGQFDQQNLQNQYTLSQLQDLQRTLSNQNSNLARFEQDLFGVLDNFLNHFLLQDLNTALDYQRRTGSDMPWATSFQTYESNLFTWATVNAADSTRAGTSTPLVYDITALTPLSFTDPSQPIGFRINGLRTMPTQFGQPALGSSNVVNPTTWAVNGDTYGYFMRQNPWYAARVLGNSTRVNSILTLGSQVQSVMTNARREGLYTALISDYQTKLGAVKTAIDAVEAQVMQNYPGIDVFGPASQTIAKSILDNTASDPNNRNYPPALMPIYNAGCANVTPYVINVGGTLYGCTTGNYCNGVPGTCPLRTPLAGDPPVTTQDSQQYVGNLDAWGWDASHAFLPAEYKVAAALKLDGPVSGGRGRDLQHYVFAWRLAGSSGALDASPGWSSVSNGVSSGNLDVELWWNPNNNADMAPRSSSNAELQPFYAPGDNRGMTLVATRRFALSMTTNNQCGYSLTPYQALGNRWQRVNAACLDCSCTSVNGQTMYDHFFDAHSPDLTNSSPQTYVWTASTIVDQGSLSTVRAEIEDKLKSLQYQIYDSIANALADSSNNLGVKNAADLATVPIKAIDAYASLGVPESLRRSEILRGILRGNELGLDRAAMYRYYRSLADGIQAGTRLTARPQPFWDPSPSVSSVARTRTGYLQNEIHAIVTANRPEQPPMMQWAMAELTHLQNNVARTASDDRYVMRRSATSLQVAPPGVLANDQPAPRPAGQAAILRATLYSVPPPGAGSVVLNQDGGFSYTPPSPLPANLTSVTFQYQASASLVPPSTNLGDMVTSNVVTVTIDIADDCVPTIVAQPQATEFALNGSATFFVRADAQERVTYRWYRDGVALTDTAFGACCLPDGSCSVADQPSCAHLGGDWHGQGTVCGGLQVCYSCPLAACPPPPTATIVSGARTPLLTISNLHTADRGTYTCVVSSSCGSVATSAARLGSCPADFNNSGVLEVQDIFDFLNAWFAGNLSADFNNSGVLEVQDIFDFLNAWFAGC